jgi:sigma-B regulation protein RsbU (phosphoserine phosphatase)
MGLYGERAPGAKSITLQPADTLLLFTDGVTEAMNLHNEEFGEEALATTLASGHAQDSASLVSQVFAAADQFARGAEQADDITLLAFRRLA